MAFKLIEAAQGRWRAVNAPHLVALVRAGATFDGGKLVERPDDHTSTRGRLKDLHPQVLTIAPVIRANPLSDHEQAQLARACEGVFDGLWERDDHGGAPGRHAVRPAPVPVRSPRPPLTV